MCVSSMRTSVMQCYVIVSADRERSSRSNDENGTGSIYPHAHWLTIAARAQKYRISSKNSALLIIRHPLPND